MKKNNVELWAWRVIFAATLIYLGTAIAFRSEDDDCKKLALENYDLSVSLREANKTADSLRANEQSLALQIESLRNQKAILERSLNDARQRFNKEEEKFTNFQQRIEELQMQVFYMNQAIRNLLDSDSNKKN